MWRKAFTPAAAQVPHFKIPKHTKPPSSPPASSGRAGWSNGSSTPAAALPTQPAQAATFQSKKKEISLPVMLLEVLHSPVPPVWHSSVHPGPPSTPPASQPPRAMPERDGMEGHSMAEGSVIAPLACPQARTHKWSSRKKVKVCSTAASRPSAKGAAIKNHENKQCGGNTCCPLSAASCSFSPDGGDGGPVTVLSPRAGPRTGARVWCHPSARRGALPCGGEAAVRVSALSLSGGRDGALRSLPLGGEDDCKGLQIAVHHHLRDCEHI